MVYSLFRIVLVSSHLPVLLFCLPPRPEMALPKAWSYIKSNAGIIYLGLGQSCFEGAMYAFVFSWYADIHLLRPCTRLSSITAASPPPHAPQLQPPLGLPLTCQSRRLAACRRTHRTPALQAGGNDVGPYLGVIFSTFMVCTMIGSNIFGMAMNKNLLGTSPTMPSPHHPHAHQAIQPPSALSPTPRMLMWHSCGRWVQRWCPSPCTRPPPWPTW